MHDDDKKVDHDKKENHDKKEEHDKKTDHEKKVNHEKKESKHESAKKEHVEHHAHKHKSVKKENKLDWWKILTFVFGALFILSLAINMSSCEKQTPDNGGTTTTPPTNAPTATGGDIKITLLNDARCSDCDARAQQVISQLKNVFPQVEIVEVDYSDAEGEALFKSANVKTLPAFLFDKEAQADSSYSQVAQYVEPAGEYTSLRVGSEYDPTKEVCGNGKDDTGDGLVDCASPDCSGVWECVEKADKPIVELFVMSHCPYGTQMEKGILPVAQLLGDKIDFQLKFVNYAMHEQKEIDEQMNQYCIDKEYPDKLLDYLECFLGTTAGSAAEGKACMEELELDTDAIASCVSDADAEFGISADYDDKSKWKGQFPPFNLHDADNQKYGVRGSPSLRINGAEPSAGRDAKSLLSAICFAFSDQPEECEEEIDVGAPTPGFGWEAAPAGAAPSAAAGCGA